MSNALRRSRGQRRARRFLRLAAWSIAVLFAVVLAFIGRTLIIHLLQYAGVGWHRELATLAVSAWVLWLMLPPTRGQHRAIVGSILVLLAAFDWVVSEVAVAVYGVQPPMSHSFGPFTPTTTGEWMTLLIRFELAWWSLLLAAGLILLITAHGRQTTAADFRQRPHLLNWRGT